MGGRVEWAWNKRYGRDEQMAAFAGRHLWNSSACGAGPAAGVRIALWVDWNPVGGDRSHGGEWVKVRNDSADRPLRLGGWRIRDASHLEFRFPRGTVLRPGQVATLRTRPGRRRGHRFFWGIRRIVFENPSHRRHTGGGAYLVDPDGDIRAAMHYPCLVAYSSPLRGGLGVRAVPRHDERVIVRNRTAAPVGLVGYAVAVPGGLLPLRDHLLLRPGRRVVVRVPGHRRLRDRGGSVRVVTFNGIRVACDAWRRGRC